MKIILDLIRKNLWQYVFATLVSAVAGVSGALLIKHIHSAMRTGLPENFLVIFGLYLFASVVLGVWGAQMLTRLSEGNLKDLRVRLSRSIMRASYRKIEMESDKIIPILTTDIATIGATAAKLPDVITSIVIVAGCFIYMAYLSWQLTLFALGIFLVNFLMTVVVMPITRKQEDSARELRYEIFRHLKEMVNGLRELSFKKKLRRVYVNHLIEPTIERQVDLKLRNTLIINSFAKLETLLVMGALAFGVFYAHGKPIFDSKSFTEFLALALFLIAPMTKINAFFRVINRTKIALSSIEDLGISLTQLKMPKAKEVPIADWKPTESIITFRNITRTYEQEDQHDSFKLGPVNMDIQQGEMVFIVGGNGSGKTTLVKILTGLYAPDKGKLIYKGHVIKDRFLENYQDNFCALFTEDHVFKILYHIDRKTLREKGQEYLNLLELDSKVKIKERKFSTTNLSYGQRKRLNLVMALLENKEIYVFDEWAANQDPYFKSLFYTKILKQLKESGRTVFVISHDDSYFHVADRIVKLQDGQVLSNEKVK